MTCKVIIARKEVTVIACSRGHTKHCVKCGRSAGLLCDFPLTGVKKGTTCDRPICSGCAKRVGPSRDYCPAHASLAEAGDQR
jgi:hypothetical protein